ncbi:MAG TPA: TIGR03668 family PPOX class F420-dependent oxidoreductase [Methylomirabilota bacterium]|nr:TIGR03668 family PPOX class F420-dependent oxidoreductase [Methylomirabilota bacterium]
MQLTRRGLRLLRSARVAHLATADANGQPLVVPICFAFDGKEFVSTIDEKPKQTPPTRLKRLRNITANPKVSLIIDHYDEDWHRLAYLLIRGTAKILLRGARHRRGVYLLRRKYPQYRNMAINDRPMIVITPKQLTSWGDL